MGGRAVTVLPNTMREYIASRDHRIMLRVNQWSAPRWIRVWMICATRGGDGWLWYIMTIAVLLFGDGQKYVAVAASGMAVLTGVFIFLVAKRMTGRKRPCAIQPHCWATLLPPDQFSFPSGHTITAFAVALSLGLFYPSLMIGLLFCAVSIAVSRILLGMHFLSDVVVGAGVGSVLGCLAFYIYG